MTWSAEELEQRFRYLAATADPPWMVRGVPEGGLEEVERRLGVTLPPEVHATAAFFAGDTLGYTDHKPWDASDPSGVVAETLRLRGGIGLAHRLLFLAESSVSVVVLDTRDGVVVECGTYDIERIADRTWDQTATIHPSYLDLLATMIDDEFAERDGS